MLLVRLIFYDIILGIDINVCNKKLFGYMLNTGTDDMTVEDRKIMFVSAIVDYMGEFFLLFP